MTELQQLIWVEATFAPSRTDDLRDRVPPIGYRGKFQALWIIEDGPYEGDWAMQPDYDSPYVHWIPSRDLQDFAPLP